MRAKRIAIVFCTVAAIAGAVIGLASLSRPSNNREDGYQSWKLAQFGAAIALYEADHRTHFPRTASELVKLGYLHEAAGTFVDSDCRLFPSTNAIRPYPPNAIIAIGPSTSDSQWQSVLLYDGSTLAVSSLDIARAIPNDSEELFVLNGDFTISRVVSPTSQTSFDVRLSTR